MRLIDEVVDIDRAGEFRAIDDQRKLHVRI